MGVSYHRAEEWVFFELLFQAFRLVDEIFRLVVFTVANCSVLVSLACSLAKILPFPQEVLQITLLVAGKRTLEGLRLLLAEFRLSVEMARFGVVHNGLELLQRLQLDVAQGARLLDVLDFDMFPRGEALLELQLAVVNEFVRANPVDLPEPALFEAGELGVEAADQAPGRHAY